MTLAGKTMAGETGVIDANVLVYSMDAEAPQHVASRALLDAARAGSITLFVTSQVLCEFYAIVTNPRRVAKPRSSADAVMAIKALLTFLGILPTPASTIGGWLDLLERVPVTGGDIFDLQLVASMQANGIASIYTYNTQDFAPFSEISALTPQTDSRPVD